MNSLTPNTTQDSLTQVVLTAHQKTELKAKAHGLSPVVTIGEKGLSTSVIQEVELALNAHGLIKVRVHGDDRDVRLAHAQILCQTTGAALVQHIGKLLVLYRPNDKNNTATQKSPPRKPRDKKRLTKRQAFS